jgi:hypothetical protein
MKGIGYELGKELAGRMGVPYEPVIYHMPKLLVDDVNSGKWDISFIAQDPDRERILDSTGIYLRLEHGYLVPSGSTIQTISEVDRLGIRVGVPAGGSVIPPMPVGNQIRAYGGVSHRALAAARHPRSPERDALVGASLLEDK